MIEITYHSRSTKENMIKALEQMNTNYVEGALVNHVVLLLLTQKPEFGYNIADKVKTSVENG